MKTVVVFQGGGTLGAFAAGAWQALVPRLQASAADVVALAGASIGALNVARVGAAFDDGDWGAQALRQWWLDDVATPALPFVWPPGWASLGRPPGEAQRWNGLLTSLLSQSLLHQPAFWHWHAWGLLHRRRMPLYERPRLKRQLAALAQQLAARQRGPLVAVAASDVQDGHLRLFDSDAGLHAAHLEASSAIPVLYAPVEIDGRLYWDGELNQASMLDPLLPRLQSSGRLRAGEPLRLVTVEQVRAERPDLPLAGPEVADFALSILLRDKFGLQPPRWDGPLEWLRVRRPTQPEEALSGQFDASPERLAALIEQGVATAEAAWAERPVVLKAVAV